MTPILYACCKCFARVPFNELSPVLQLCKTCIKKTDPCIYCRSEFKSKMESQKACRLCLLNLKKYGAPSVCKYCEMHAAFDTEKCERCKNYYTMYGSPRQCEECRQWNAFDKRADKKKEKLCCWPCSCALRRGGGSAVPARSTDISRTFYLFNENCQPFATLQTSDFSDERKLKKYVLLLQKQLVQKCNELRKKDESLIDLQILHILNKREIRKNMRESRRLQKMEIINLQKKIADLSEELAELKGDPAEIENPICSM